MAWFAGTRRTLAQGVGVIGAALLLWASAPGMAPLGQAAHAASARETIAQALVGTWLGPALGDSGECGVEYGQFTFFRNQEYSYTMNSDYQEIRNPQGQITRINDCGGITNAGYYAAQRGVLTIRWLRCNYPCSPGAASVRFTFLNINTFEIADQGGVYIYYRQ